MTFSPIVCFGYDRPNHLNNLLSSLEKNPEAQDSDVTISIDGVNENTNLQLHNKTLEVANQRWNFKSTNILYRKTNLGCRENILTSINEMFDKTNKLIILEDDLLLGKYFLDYMNKSLIFYENYSDIWHINGYSYPQLVNNSTSASISRFVSPWGWGTWKNRWETFISKNYHKENIISNKNSEDIYKFNHNGLYDWEDIIKKHQLQKTSIWDAYWYQAVFLENGYSVFPNKSFVQNFGFDGTGVHCSDTNDWKTKLNNKKIRHFPKNIDVGKVHYLNTIIFYKFYNFKRYLRYHKSKFESFNSFKNFIMKKFKLLF